MFIIFTQNTVNRYQFNKKKKKHNLQFVIIYNDKEFNHLSGTAQFISRH